MTFLETRPNSDKQLTRMVYGLHASCVMEAVNQTRYCLFAWHRNCNPELILKSYASMGYQVVFRNKPLLHL